MAKPSHATALDLLKRRDGEPSDVMLSSGRLIRVYNIAWGLTTTLYPQWLYRLTGGPTHDRAEMASALGLVIGLYGVLYLEVARVPERGALIAAVGLAGKIIGPIGLIVLVARGTWPASSLMISATNDFIWWIPFALYLHDRRRAGSEFPRRS